MEDFTTEVTEYTELVASRGREPALDTKTLCISVVQVIFLRHYDQIGDYYSKHRMLSINF